MHGKKLQIASSIIVTAAACALIASSESDCSDIIEVSSSNPLRIVVQQLEEFQLCELDRDTLEQRPECMPAKVPGDVFTALMRAERIPDPYKDMNSKKVQWVDKRAWQYKTSFKYQEKPGKRLRILFMGIDYISQIELNNEVLVKRREGMFSRVDLDLTGHLDPSGEQHLSVVLFGIEPPKTELLKKIAGINIGQRRKYLKTQMSFDWDFAPRLKGAGIWDRVYLYETGQVRIKDVFVKPHLDGRLDIEVDLAGEAEKPCTLKVEISEVDSKKEPIKKSIALGPGNIEGTKSMSITVPDPKLWWPWDMGDPSTYLAVAKVYVNDLESDIAGETFGIREIEWGKNPDAPEGFEHWVLYVNGRREFMRGANWVPLDCMYGRAGDGRYGKLLGMAKEAGMNMVRVWGGGNRERREFYDLCDRMGIMVWQEFPFACVFLRSYPRTRQYKDLVQQETTEIVRQLRNHPSLVMWCGGNEFNIKQNRHVVSIMESATGELDPTRRFLPGSPVKGDSHNWVVWHGMGNLLDYFEDESPFPSEFGLQAMPEVSTIEKYFSPQYRWPPDNQAFVHHDIGVTKMNKYVPVIGHDGDLESYVEASQAIQAHFLQRGIEHWRQDKYRTSGIALWMLNDAWPAVSWSVIDYELKPKRAYHVLKDAFNPVLVTAAYEDRAWQPGDTFKAGVMVVNDLHKSFRQARVSAKVCEKDAGSWSADVAEDAVTRFGEIEMKIPGDCKRPRLSLGLSHRGEEISKNAYELWIHDPEPAGFAGRLSTDITHWIMTGVYPERYEYAQ